MNIRWLLAVSAAVFIVAALTLMVVPIASGGVHCGNGISVSDSDSAAYREAVNREAETFRSPRRAVGTGIAERCTAAMDTRRMIAGPLAVLGVGCFFGVAAIPTRRPATAAD